MDLRDLWRPGGGASKLTYRLLGVLLHGLPGHSAYKTAVRDSIPDEQLAALAKRPREHHGVWSHTDLRLANIEDLLAMQVRGLRPTNDWAPVPRPGVARAATRRALSPEGFAYLQKIRHDHERANGYGIGAEEAG